MLLEYVKVAILGLVQGVTEFLPISSSGHLVIFSHLLGVSSDIGVTLVILLHTGTLMSVLVYYHRRIFVLFLSFVGMFVPRFRSVYHQNKVMMWGIIIANIPTGIVGLLMATYLEALFLSLTLVGFMLLVTSFLLFVSDMKVSTGDLTLRKSFILGIVQGLSIIPGVSRSGSTIVASILMNISREKAVEFSFLLSAPAIVAAATLRLLEFDPQANLLPIGVYVLGGFVAFASGIVSIHFVIGLVKRAQLKVFALYCLVVGVSAILVSLF